MNIIPYLFSFILLLKNINNFKKYYKKYYYVSLVPIKRGTTFIHLKKNGIELNQRNRYKN